MAYRRRHGRSSSTFMEETLTTTSPTAASANNYDDDDDDSSNCYSSSSSNNIFIDAVVSNSSSSSSSLAAQAIRASAAHRDSSHSSAYTNNYLPKGGGPTYDYTSMGSSNEAAGISSFWGVLARKAKAILDDDVSYHPTEYGALQLEITTTSSNSKKTDANNPPTIRKGIDAFTTKMNRIGDTIGNAFEEGRTIVENKTADLIQETRKLQRRNINGDDEYSVQSPRNQINLTTQEDQIKASRDVAMATAAKAKLLLRELKTIKAGLAFAKQRCSQLEEENKILRDARHHNAGGVHPEEDEMIRLQLETLLAEKSRLANENSVYARENRFLREIVEYHQLTMQDVVYIDEGIEEVTEVYPSRRMSVSPPSPRSPSSPSALSRSSTASRTSSVSLTLSLNKDNLINMQLPPRDAVINPNIHRSDSLPTLACASQKGNQLAS